MYSVLVVEDDLQIQKILRVRLEGHGYTVDTAVSVEAACEALDKSPPDLVILDLTLPDGDGFDVLCRIKRFMEQCIVIVLTARTEEADRVLSF